MLEEARAYISAARQINSKIRFFGITAEINPARLQKVVSQRLPLVENADIDYLVHLHAPLATTQERSGNEQGTLLNLSKPAPSLGGVNDDGK